MPCLLALGLEPEDPAEDPPPPDVPGYRVIRFLGEGGMGTVHLAEELDLRRRVALKLISGPTGRGRRADALSRFLREARLMAAVEHPHIVTVYRVGRADDGRAFLAMEFVDGETLAERIRRQGRLPTLEALELVRQAAEALAAAWDRGVVHRDLKPSNLLLDRRGRIRVADFGLALAIGPAGGDDRLTGSGMLLGTPAYCSPEQIRGEALDFRADVYSLGIVLWEALAGSPPFAGESPFAVARQHLERELPAFPAAVRVPPAVEELVRWMAARTPGERPGSYGELLHSLDAVRTALERGVGTLDPTGTLPLPEGARVARGPRVVQRCDRRRQMLAFAHHFREHRAREPGRPVAYLVRGGEGQGHDSLIDRFVHEHVARVLEAEGRRGEVVVRRVGWPEGEERAELRAHLLTELFTEVEPTTGSVDLSARAFLALERLRHASAVVLHHPLRARDLHGPRRELVRWCLEELWSDLAVDGATPQLVVFLALVTTPEGRGGWTARFGSHLRQLRAERALVRLFSTRGRGMARLALHPLGPVGPEDVEDWMVRHRIVPSEKARRDLARSLFRRPEGPPAAGLPMAEIEDALHEIHIRSLRDKGLYP